MQLIILRAAGVYGPSRFGMGSHSARFFERVVYAASLGDPIRIRGTWQDCDDYIYVKDLGQGIALAATGRVEPEVTIFNLGTGVVSTLRDVVDSVKSAFPAASITVEQPENARPSIRVPLNIRRIRQTLGFVPRYTLSMGLEDFAADVGLSCNG